METFEPLRWFTAQELLELLRRMNGDCTDYRLAKLLEMTQTGIIAITKHGGTLSDEKAILAAELLKLPPSYVILCMHLQRAKDEKLREAWQDMAAKYLKVGCFVIAGYLLNFLPSLPFMS